MSAGSTIAAALITGLSSDLPGQIVAQVTEDVFDTVSDQTRLIPQGTRLIGAYDAGVSYGQFRALVVWTRLIFPDGRSIDLDRMVGTDAAGQSGLADRVDNHIGKLLVAGLLSTLFGVGANAATTGGGDNADIAFAIRESAGRSVESAGDKIVGRQLDVQPTIWSATASSPEPCIRRSRQGWICADRTGTDADRAAQRSLDMGSGKPLPDRRNAPRIRSTPPGYAEAA